jgi:hypothetical protein
MIRYIKEILFPAKKPTTLGLKFAFTCGGKNFYHFEDELHYPVERALSATDIYAELEAKMSREYLIALFDELEGYLNSGKLTSAVQTLLFAKDRLTHVTHLGLMYKLASVLYIGEDEDPNRYSLSEGEAKIAFWKKHKGVKDFFLSLPIGELLPSFASSEMNLESYTQAQMESLGREESYQALTKGMYSTVGEKGRVNTLLSVLEKELQSLKSITIQ